MKRFISIVTAFSLLLSMGTAFAEETKKLPYEDSGVGNNYWEAESNHDSYHGTVYKFSSAEESSESEELFGDEFENGTYIVSLDFKIDGTMESDSSASIEIESETSKDKTIFHIFENGDANIEIRDYDKKSRLKSTNVKSEMDWSVWRNYSIIYEKDGDNLSITQYLDGEKLHDAVISYDNFRFKKIIVNHPKSDDTANLYIDNIVCRKMSDSEQFAFEKITPIQGEGNDIDYIEIKLNNVANKSSVSQVSVVNKDNVECIDEFKVIGQYIYAEVKNIGKDDKFTLTVTGAKDLLGNSLEKPVYSTDTNNEQEEETDASYEVLHNDYDAALDTKWTKQENYDEEHGNVYFFAKGATYEGTDWFSSEFEDGTYVVSMDFKVPAYPESGTTETILVDSEAWNDRTQLELCAGGTLGYTIRDAGGVRQPYDAKYGTNYAENEWNNYSIVYEKSGTDVDVTQYVNGVKVKSTATRISDNFRFRRITFVTSASNSGLYLDNIVVMRISADEFTAKAKPCKENKVSVTFNNIPLQSTLEKIEVKDTENNAIEISSRSFCGNVLEIELVNGTNNAEYSVKFNPTFSSVIGGFIKQDAGGNSGGGQNEEPEETDTSDEVLHNDCDAALDDVVWTKQENYDEEHGNVYFFAKGATYEGTDWFSSEFEDGTYVVSMDFKVPAYPESGTTETILVDSEAWNDRTQLELCAEGTVGYTIRDAGGVRQPYDAKYGTNYAENEWNNYSIVYEKSGTDVDVTQYVNGIRVKGAATRISDNFRFRRITIVTSASNSGLYLDNIVVMRISDDEFTAKAAPCKANKVSVTFNNIPLQSTLEKIEVEDAENNAIEISSRSFCGNVLEIELVNGTDDAEYSVKFNPTFSSVIGGLIKQDTGGSSGGNVDDSGFNQSLYGALAYSSGKEQIFEIDATVYKDDVRHGDVLNLISSSDQYVGLKEDLKAKLDLEELIIACDFKVGANAYLNNVGISGRKEGVRVRRNGHLFSNFYLSAQYMEGVGPTGGAKISDVPWPEDGRWVNICFVSTSSGVEFYLDNEFIAKSPYGIGAIIDVLAHFKPTNHTQLDNFMIIDKNNYLLTAKTSLLTAYKNGENAEICVSFTAPISKTSLSGLTVKDKDGNIMEIGTPEVMGANLFIPLIDGEVGEKYDVSLSGIEGISGLVFQNGPQLVETSIGSVVQPSVMKCAFESFNGDKKAYAIKTQPLIKKTMLTFTGLFTEEELKSQIHIYCGSQSIPFEINIQEDEGIGITVAECVFNEVLKPNSEYRIDISGSLTERIANELTIGATKSYYFRTEDCDDLVTLSGIADGVVEKDVQIYKKSGFSQAFFHAATKKSTVNMNIDGVERAVEKLDEFHYKVTQIPESSEGVQTLSLDDFANCEYSLWTWPDLADMNK